MYFHSFPKHDDMYFSHLQPTHMADFSHIQAVQTIVGEVCLIIIMILMMRKMILYILYDAQSIHLSYMNIQAGQGKSVLQLRVAGSAELLTITCPSMAEAENMADLVDGYCRLVNQSSTSIWSRKGMLSFLLLTFCSGF